MYTGRSTVPNLPSFFWNGGSIDCLLLGLTDALPLITRCKGNRVCTAGPTARAHSHRGRHEARMSILTLSQSSLHACMYHLRHIQSNRRHCFCSREQISGNGTLVVLHVFMCSWDMVIDSTHVSFAEPL
jgi:hypothetical protein